MSKLEDREKRRRSIVGSMIQEEQHTPAPPAAASNRGRPKEGRETKKRVSLVLLPSLYEDIQKIAYVQHRSASQLVADALVQYRDAHHAELERYFSDGD